MGKEAPKESGKAKIAKKKAAVQVPVGYQFSTVNVLSDPTGKLGKKVDLWTPTLGDRSLLVLPHGKDFETAQKDNSFGIRVGSYMNAVNKFETAVGKSISLALRSSAECL
jgi:hypothetical protein